jgi:cytochrome c-type biogenesis protein CcmE
VADAAGGAVQSVWPVTKSRRRAIAALSLCAVAIVAIVVLTVVLSENVVYFRTVSEAVAEKKSESERQFRMAGKVVPGTVEETAKGVNFEVTDGKATVAVVHRGDPPSLFKDGAPVVCEGRWSGAVFASDRIMIRHGSEYKPPKVDVSDTDALGDAAA